MCKLCSWGKPDPLPDIIVPDEKMDKYAFITGINLYKTAPESNLRGCVYDAEFLRHRLINEFQFHPDNIRMLLDLRATQNAIKDHMYWLVDHEDSILFGSFSGHGTQERDRDGDELDDGMDEAICPTDMDFDDLFTDDKIGVILEHKPPSSTLAYLFDCCHSGTITRNFFSRGSFSFRHQPVPRFLRPPRDIQFRSQGQSLKIKKLGSRLMAAPNYVILSGCMDHQTSADAWIEGKWRGAFTHFYGKYFYRKNSYIDIYQTMVNEIQSAGYSQTPQFNGVGLDEPMLGG